MRYTTHKETFQPLVPVDAPLFEVMTPERIEWFWSKVDRSGGGDACHPWTGAVGSGYGQIRWPWGRSGRQILRRVFQAHRVAWALTYDFDPDTFARPVRHLCNTPLCCNPRHLVYDLPHSVIRKVVGRARTKGQAIARHSPADSAFRQAATNLAGQ